ncbi:SOS response-associated peptidase family protein [Halomonas tibetensis]|uniref:SOS response-associated peptidase family protein n=1 Tax=Halomonas tibetensis TaxID=2259590 RepID=A0ABV7B9P1_9GAMM
MPGWLEDAENGLTDAFHMLLAGLAEDLRHLDDRIDTVTANIENQVQTDAGGEALDDIAREIYDRMPLVLDDQSLEAWLDPVLTEREAIRAALNHLEAEALAAWPVSTRVNRSNQEGAYLVERVIP